MAGFMGLEIGTRLRSVRARIGSSVRVWARDVELAVGRRVAVQLAKYPEVRPYLREAGLKLGSKFCTSPEKFRFYFGVADFLAERGKAIFPDYQAYSSRMKIIRENPCLASALSPDQVKSVLQRIPPRKFELITGIKHFYVHSWLDIYTRTGTVPYAQEAFEGQFNWDEFGTPSDVGKFLRMVKQLIEVEPAQTVTVEPAYAGRDGQLVLADRFGVDLRIIRDYSGQEGQITLMDILSKQPSGSDKASPKV